MFARAIKLKLISTEIHAKKPFAKQAETMAKMPWHCHRKKRKDIPMILQKFVIDSNLFNHQMLLRKKKIEKNTEHR